jgi:hypothetical protein
VRTPVKHLHEEEHFREGNIQVSRKLSPLLMEIENSLLLSQKPASNLYPEP